MPFSLFHTKKEKKIAILDIGSSSVGGAVVSLGGDTAPKVLFSVREDMVFQRDLNLERFTSSMLQSLERVLNKLEKSEEEKPHTFFCILSSPWYESETKIIKIKKDKPFIITHKILDELTEKEVSAFRLAMDANNIAKDLTGIIDIKNIQIKLNGYETSNPYNKSAENMEAALFIGLGSKKILKAIKNKVSKIFYVKDIVFSTFSLSSFSTVRDIFSDKSSFLFLDITGEVTDVSLVEDNVLVKSISFPLGKNFIVRRIASGMNTIPEEAKSLLNMMRTGKSNKETNIYLENILREVRKKWLASFTQGITTLSKGHSVPSTVFFTADSDIAEWFVESIEKEEFAQVVLTSGMFDVRFLDAKVLEKFCSFKKGTMKDPFIALEAIFANKNQDIF